MQKAIKKRIIEEYKAETNRIANVPNAKNIMDRNEKVFVEIMGEVMKILTDIKQSKDYEFKMVMCNTLSDQFRSFGFNIAIAKLAELESHIPKNTKGTHTIEYVDRMIG